MQYHLLVAPDLSFPLVFPTITVKLRFDMKRRRKEKRGTGFCLHAVPLPSHFFSLLQLLHGGDVGGLHVVLILLNALL